MVLDDKTIEWLLNTCPEDLLRPSRIRTRSNDEEKGVAYYALVDFHVSTDISIHN